MEGKHRTCFTLVIAPLLVNIKVKALCDLVTTEGMLLFCNKNSGGQRISLCSL